MAIAAYLNSPEAHMLRGRLEAEGIPAFVAEGNALGATAGVRVLVRQDDFAAALKIKRECGISN